MKKNILTTLVACILVAALAVGGTLAYMTATDDRVTNTFQFANNMTVSLTEEQPAKTGDETITAGTKGYNYTNVTPGQTLNKAPKVSVTTSVDAYVFVRISGFDGNLISCNGITTGWTKLEVAGVTGTNANGVYYKTVDGKDGAQDLGTVFEKVTIGTNQIGTDGNTLTIPNVVIEVAAIQQVGFEGNPAAAYAQAQFKAAA